MFRLLESLREGRLAGSRGAAIRPYLGPAFAEKVAKFPACLYCGAEELFVGGFAFALVLAEAEKHLGERPAGFEERVSFSGEVGALFH